MLAADEDNIVTGVEIKTSKTYNGKPVYKYMASLTTASSATGTFYSTSITNAENAHIVDGWIKGSDGYNHSLNSVWSTNSNLFTFTDVKDDAAYIYQTINQSNLFSCRMFVIIEYTKTTD